DRDTGKIVDVVKYVFEEDGEKKQYERKIKNKADELDYLIQRLSEVPEGAEVILEMKKNGMKNYIEVTYNGEVDSVDYEDNDHEPSEQDVDQAMEEYDPDKDF